MSVATDSLFGLIQISSSIKIKRSDGRIHLAKVVQLSSESKSVGVEWNEQGEVKGKEILLDLVFELNNELRPNTSLKQSITNVNQQVRPTAAIPVPSNGLSSSRLTLDIDSLEREYNSRPPPVLPPQLLQRIQQHPVSIQTTSTPLPPPPLNGTIAGTTHSKASCLPSGTNNTTAARSIRRPTTQINSSSTKTVTPSSPVPPPTPTVEQPQQQPQLQIPVPVNNKNERRLSRLHVVQQTSTTTTTHNTVVSEPPPSIGLHGPFGQMILDYRSTLTYTPITNSNMNQHKFDQKDLRICVAIRKRPLNKREIAKKDNDVITIPNKDHCLVHVPKSKVDLTKFLDNQTFKFDYTFDERASNDLVYRYTASPLIDTIFNGGNATVFAYGQTGSGKTFTMGGDVSSAKVDYSHGIYAQTARDIFHRLSLPQYRSSIEIFVTFYEIYCGKVFDLLNNKKRLRVLEDQKGLVQVCDRKEQQVKSVQDVLNIIQHGMSIRTSGTTAANSNSSRSHAVLQIILKTSTPISIHSNVSSSSSTSSSSRNNNHNNPAVPRRVIKEVGKMSLIDLAGSERGKDTASGDRLQRMEGSEINKSLLALKECIRALGRGDGTHVPFRGSTLTKVLRDSFIGDKSKVCMIAMVSPTHSDVENTMNTLRYADRVKELRASDSPGTPSNEDDEIQMDHVSKALPIDDNKENKRRHHHQHHHYPHHRDGSASSNDSTSSSSNDGQNNFDDDDDDEQDEALASYAAQVEHLQEYEEALFDTCQEILTHKEPILTRQLRTIIKQAQDTVDYDQEKFVNDMRANLLQRQQILNELQTRLQAFSDCLQQEEQVAAEQRNKQHQSNSNIY
ncbi:unnamed protein product [Rotaria sp. Silwood1]|nr:unnamed protein product [Rotaria sp. Silwood1]